MIFRLFLEAGLALVASNLLNESFLFTMVCVQVFATAFQGLWLVRKRASRKAKEASIHSRGLVITFWMAVFLVLPGNNLIVPSLGLLGILLSRRAWLAAWEHSRQNPEFAGAPRQLAYESKLLTAFGISIGPTILVAPIYWWFN